MRRGLAALVALSVVSLQGQSLAFHVHATDGRQPVHHRHAPAIHHHDDDSGASGEEPHFSDPDAERSSITLTIPAAAPFSAVHLFADIPAALAAPVLQLSDRSRVVDMRSHGPPGRLVLASRAPPQQLPV